MQRSRIDNFLFLGTPGAGKVHIALALGLTACPCRTARASPPLPLIEARDET
jgi:DNA replication protein DnaC